MSRHPSGGSPMQTHGGLLIERLSLPNIALRSADFGRATFPQGGPKQPPTLPPIIGRSVKIFSEVV